MLSEAQRARLLGIARSAMEGQVAGRGGIELEPGDLPEASGVFVTIKRRGELRGCLGVLSMTGSLADEVARCARVRAAQGHDSRLQGDCERRVPDRKSARGYAGGVPRGGASRYRRLSALADGSATAKQETCTAGDPSRIQHSQPTDRGSVG